MSIRPMRPNGYHSHNVIQACSNRAKPPTGQCLYWQVVDGKATQCGAACKGQRCDEHKSTTLGSSLDYGRERKMF